jgi:hypothetical protein
MGFEGVITQALSLNTELLKMHDYVIGLIILILVLIIHRISFTAFFFYVILFGPLRINMKMIASSRC